MQTARSKTRAAAAEESKRYCKVGLADCGSDLGLDIIGREKFFMKKMKRAALAMASVTAISLVGCGGSNTTTTADTKAAGESSAEGGNSGDISGNITFSWWGGDSRHEATEKAIEAFQAKYEGVTVSPEYGAWSGWEEKQSLNILGGNSADLM